MEGGSMNKQELDQFLEAHQNIEWQEDTDAILFRNANLPWYQEDEHRATRVTVGKLQQITPDQLLQSINQGLDVECITRITGYFAKTRSFNPGKTAELKERYKPALE
jgi:hypothetical protein